MRKETKSGANDPIGKVARAFLRAIERQEDELRDEVARLFDRQRELQHPLAAAYGQTILASVNRYRAESRKRTR